MTQPYEPISFYDAPALTLSQGITGSLSASSLMDTWFNQGHALTPLQRQDFRTYFEEALGDTKVGNAFVGVATNPFVWAAFLLGPRTGGAALKQVGKGIRAADARLFGNWMARSNLLPVFRTGNQAVDGTAGGAAAHATAQNIENLKTNWWAVEHEKSQDKLLSRLFEIPENQLTPRHVQMWRGERAIQDPVLREKVEKARMLLSMAGHAMDRSRTIKNATFIPAEIRLRPKAGGDAVIITDPNERVKIWRHVEDRIAEGAIPSGEFTYTKNKETHVIESDGFRVLEMTDMTAPALLKENVDLRAEMLKLDESLLEHYETTQRLARRRLGLALFKGTDVRDSTPQQIDALMEHARSLVRQNKSIDHLIDPVKVENAVRGTSGRNFQTRNAGMDDVLDGLLSRRTRAEILRTMQGYSMTKSKPTLDRIQEELVQYMTRNLALDNYVPRNTGDFVVPVTKAGTSEILRLRTATQREIANSGVTALSTSGRLRPIEEAATLHPDDLDAMEKLFPHLVDAREVQRLRRVAEKKINKSISSSGRPVGLLRMDYTRAMDTFERQTTRDIALFATRLDGGTIASQSMIFNDPEHPQAKLWKEQSATDTLERSFYDSKFDAPRYERSMLRVMDDSGKWTYADVFEQTGVMLDRYDQQFAREHGRPFRSGNGEMWREVFFPAVMGTKPEMFTLGEFLSRTTQRLLDSFVDSGLAKTLLQGSEIGKNMLRELEHFRTLDPKQIGRRIDANMAGWLYSAHLGVNVGSVILNMTQPFLHAALYGGFPEVLKAYGGAIDDLGNYARVRWSRPEWKRLDIDPLTRREIAKAAGIEFFEETGILGRTLEDLDRIMWDHAQRRGGSFRYFTQDFPLKAFEKGEWMNRFLTTRIVRQRYEKLGLTGLRADGTRWYKAAADMTAEQVQQDMSNQMARAVQEFQFGASEMNTPAYFMNNQFLSNPLIRQFMTFVHRTPLTVIEMAGKMQGRSHLADRPFAQMGEIGKDVARMMGISAVVYEVGKAAGLDLGRGGAAQAFADVVQGDRFMETSGDASIPIQPPPVLGISIDAVRGVLGGDSELLGSAIARTIPGGVALSRALGSAPSVQDAPDLFGLPANLQRNYVDWKNPLMDGRVAYFKADGSLVDYRNPFELILKGLGVPLESHKHAMDFDRWLVKSRDKAVQMRSQWMDAVMGNNWRKAQEVAAQFQKEFGFPLTVTKSQITSRMDSRTTARPERMLDRIDPTLRQQYMEASRSQMDRLNIAWQQFQQGTSVGQRGPRENRPGQLDEKTLEVIRQAARDENTTRFIEEGGVTPYRSY